MKRISFKVAKALKKAGYPQDKNDKTVVYPTRGEFKGTLCGFNSYVPERDKFSINAPTYLDVWLWLWREKGIRIHNEYKKVIIMPMGVLIECENDPEEAIIAAVKHIVENNLIK